MHLKIFKTSIIITISDLKFNMEKISVNLIKWDFPENCLAPLSVSQKKKIMDIEELSSSMMNMRNDLKKSISLKNDSAPSKVDNYRELLLSYCLFEEKNNLIQCMRHIKYLEQLKTRTEENKKLCKHVETALDDFSTLSKLYSAVSIKTMTLHNATEQLIWEQEKLNHIHNGIVNYNKYFKEAEYILDKLEMPNLSVKSDLFMELTEKIERNIDFIESNINFKEAKIYLVKYRHLQSRVITIMQQWIRDLFEQATDSILNPIEFMDAKSHNQQRNIILGSADTALALFYGRFQRILPKIKPIIEIIERSLNKLEYEALLIECQQYYLIKRGLVLDVSVRKGLQAIKNSYKGDHCSLVRQACALLLHVSIDEYKLFYQFFSVKYSGLNSYLEGLCNALYDTLRPSIIHINHLETLAEICCILRIEMLEEHVELNVECLQGFGNICLQLLHDTQERLVFRAHLYLQSDVIGYNPSPGDLAYPEKLRMMEDIAETLKGEGKPLKLNNVSPLQLDVIENASETIQGSHTTFEPLQNRSNINNSPADLHGMWYPTVRRTLVCLSRLYRCVDRPVFQSLSREAITLCVASVELAQVKITQRASELDGLLFQIKHLLILREQIAPFQVDFTVKEYSIDFSKVKTAAYNLLEKRSRLFTLSNNALLEFFLEGTPSMKEELIDSRKHVDVTLKLSCQQLIQHVTKLLILPVINVLDTMFESLTTTTKSHDIHVNDSYSDDAMKDPLKVSEVINETLRHIKFRLPQIHQLMQLYLANRETEFILFRPIKNNVVAAFTQLYQLLSKNFTSEQQLLISCPLPEQISVMLSSTSLVPSRNNNCKLNELNYDNVNNSEIIQ